MAINSAHNPGPCPHCHDGIVDVLHTTTCGRRWDQIQCTTCNGDGWIDAICSVCGERRNDDQPICSECRAETDWRATRGEVWP